MVLLNLRHVILTFAVKHRFSKIVLQFTYTDQRIFVIFLGFTLGQEGGTYPRIYAANNPVWDDDSSDPKFDGTICVRAFSCSYADVLVLCFF